MFKEKKSLCASLCVCLYINSCVYNMLIISRSVRFTYFIVNLLLPKIKEKPILISYLRIILRMESDTSLE